MAVGLIFFVGAIAIFLSAGRKPDDQKVAERFNMNLDAATNSWTNRLVDGSGQTWRASSQRTSRPAASGRPYFAVLATSTPKWKVTVEIHEAMSSGPGDTLSVFTVYAKDGSTEEYLPGRKMGGGNFDHLKDQEAVAKEFAMCFLRAYND